MFSIIWEMTGLSSGNSKHLETLGQQLYTLIGGDVLLKLDRFHQSDLLQLCKYITDRPRHFVSTVHACPHFFENPYKTFLSPN